MTEATEPFLQGLIEVLGESEAIEFRQNYLTRKINLNERVPQGILIRAGRAGFTCWLRQNQDELGWTGKEFRFRAVKSKIRAGLEDILCQIRARYGIQVNLINQPDQWKLTVKSAADALPLPCAFLRGFVQEFCRWAGIGKFYTVDQETVTSSSGFPCCEITIQKNPLD